MALGGLEVITWFSWLTGVILLKHPWGPPSLPSWFTFSTFYSLIFLVMYIFIMVDTLVNNSNSFYQEDTHKFGRLVRAFGLTQYVAFCLLKKISFLINGKKLAKVMEILYQHDDETKTRKGRLSVDMILQVITITIGFVMLGTKGVHFVNTNLDGEQLLNSLGDVGFSIIYYIFGLIPLTILTNASFSVIIVTTQKATKIFCKFCDEVGKTLCTLVPNEHQDNGKQMEVFDILRSHQSNIIARSKKSAFMMHQNQIHQHMPKELLHLKFASRQDISDKFEKVKDLLKLTNESLASLLLWFICSIVLNLVATASQIIVIGSEGRVNLLTDVLTILSSSIFLYIIEIGQRIKEMQVKAKRTLHKRFISLPWSYEKVEITETITEIIEWEWTLNACGFFNVDRRLASGIFTLVLNYVVIFVQLNIALTEAPPVVCPDKNATIAAQ